jgi:drug/metabolite transporter (DMT)-like permease
MSGSTFTPAQYVVDHADSFPGASGLTLVDMLFSHFSGIMASTVVYFGVYCAATRNRPWVSGPLLLPSLSAGVCWGIACWCWFIGNSNLSIVVAFPIVTVGPGIVSLVIGAVFYKEVSGLRNVLLLVAAVCIYSTGAVLIAISNA